MTKQLNFFHNTIGLLPSEHREKEKKAISLSEIILKVFKDNPHTDFTPWNMHIKLGQQYLIGSIRRSMTDLTKAGDLIKTDKKRMEIQNEKNFVWKLHPKHLKHASDNTTPAKG